MREWIITNGLGSYASSTDIGGMNTRRYHGLLIASLNPPRNRTLILSKVDESIEINEKKYNLFTNDANGQISEGYKYQTKFEKDIIPIYTYKVQKVIIEKSICMLYGRNAVAVVYKIMNQKAKTKFNITPIINFRDFHAESHSLKFKYSQNAHIDKVQIDWKNGTKVNIGVKDSKYNEHINDIFYEMNYSKEKERGFDDAENHAVPGTFTVELKPNEDKTITFICSLEEKEGIEFQDITNIDGDKVIKSEVERIEKQIIRSKLQQNSLTKDCNFDINNDGFLDEDDRKLYNDLVKKFIIASDNFIVYRKASKLHTLIAGYPWFLDWGRDALIAFEGLLLIPKRYEIAKEVLLTFTNKLKKGLIPNGFSEYDGKPMYNSADASLLLFEAVNKYLIYTNDYDFVKENLYKKMKTIIDTYIDGTNLEGNNIYLDERDYLIVSGTPDIQNTWMDAKVNGKVITPRNGKAVEINAMWYNALKVMQKINEHFNKPIAQIEYAYIAKKCKKSFEKKFYNKEKKCLYDVIETTQDYIGNSNNKINESNSIINDEKVRPNQLFAISMSYPILDCNEKMAKETFITITQKLLNKYGIQTLASDEKGFAPIYEGTPSVRDSIYHQGTTWPWLLGPYYNALKNLINAEKNDEYKKSLESTLTQFRMNVANTFIVELTNGNTIGSISELYDSKKCNSEQSKNGKGAFAQAWSVSEVFRILFKK